MLEWEDYILCRNRARYTKAHGAPTFGLNLRAVMGEGVLSSCLGSFGLSTSQIKDERVSRASKCLASCHREREREREASKTTVNCPGIFKHDLVCSLFLKRAS